MLGMTEPLLVMINTPVADPGFGKGGFMRMCIVRPLLMHMRIDAMNVAAAEKLQIFLLATLVQREFQWKPWNPPGSATVL